VELVINSTGDIRCVYGEEVNLSELGRLSIQRGSHVEPTANGQWTADMSPVQGPQLGPFDCRTQALEAEVAWLNQYWLPQ
jgi:hypothetical protein